MHVAFVITRADAVGGASIHVRDLASGLLAIGHRATVLIGGRGPVTEELESRGVQYEVIPDLVREIRPWKDVLAIGRIASALRRLRPDLVSTHTAKAGLAGRAAARISGFPVLYTAHGWPVKDRLSRGAALFRGAERIAAHWCTRIVNVCDSERHLALEHGVGTPERHVVIANGVTDVPRSLRAQPAIQPPSLAFVARMEEPKDHTTVFRALANLTHLPWSLNLIGGGPREQQLRGLAAQLGIFDRIRWTGPSKDVASHLAASQAFVLSSRSEGFPRGILEAMRAGLPVAATAAGGVAESVVHGKTGILVPRADTAAMEAALAALLGSPSLRTSMGEAGRRRYESHFTFQRMFEETLALYRDILRPSNAEAHSEEVTHAKR